VNAVIPSYLDEKAKSGLATILHSHSTLFDSGIGCFPGPALPVEALEPPLQPYNPKPYRIPHTLIDDVKAAVEKMVKLGVLKPNFNSPWGSPTHAVHKPSHGIQIVTDFRMVNMCLRRKPYPMSNISELFQHIDGYDFASTLDLYMGFIMLPYRNMQATCSPRCSFEGNLHTSVCLWVILVPPHGPDTW
jgi:hypothetical protein